MNDDEKIRNLGDEVDQLKRDSRTAEYQRNEARRLYTGVALFVVGAIAVIWLGALSRHVQEIITVVAVISILLGIYAWRRFFSGPKF